MKVRSKFKINNTFIVSMEIASENSMDNDSAYWNASIKFINDVKDKEVAELSKKQINWIEDIIMKMKKEGILR